MITARLESTGSELRASLGSFTQVATGDYNALSNKPRINGIELSGDKTLDQLGVTGLTDEEIDSMF